MKKCFGLLAIVCSVFIFGCGKETGEVHKEAQKEIFEIAVFEGGNGAEQWKVLAEEFEKEHSEFRVKITASPKVGQMLKPGIIKGDAPDFIIMMDENTSGLMEMMIEERLLLDLTEMFDESLKNKILPSYLRSAKFMPYGDERIYMVPLESGARGLVYNKDLFKKRGWTVPKTWDEFFALGDEAKKEGKYLLTYPGIYAKYMANFLIPAIANHAGYEAIEDIFAYKEHSFDNVQVLEVLKQVEKIYTEGYLLPDTLSLNHLQAQQEVLDGEALFVVTGPWIEQEMKGAKREEGFSYGMTTAPRFLDDNQSYIMANYGQACIPKDAKNKAAAKEFLRFIYTDEAVKMIAEKSNSVMSVKGGLEIAKDYISDDLYQMMQDVEPFTPVLTDFELPPKTSVLSIKDKLYTDGITQLFSGQISAVDLVKNMERIFAQIREEIRIQEK